MGQTPLYGLPWLDADDVPDMEADGRASMEAIEALLASWSPLRRRAGVVAAQNGWSPGALLGTAYAPVVTVPVVKRSATSVLSIRWDAVVSNASSGAVRLAYASLAWPGGTAAEMLATVHHYTGAGDSKTYFGWSASTPALAAGNHSIVLNMKASLAAAVYLNYALVSVDEVFT